MDIKRMPYSKPVSEAFLVCTERNFAETTETNGLHQMDHSVDIYDESFGDDF